MVFNLFAVNLMICSGFSILSDDRNTYAFTNLLDGIDLYSPAATLTYQRSIAQEIDQHNNLALGLIIVGNEYIISGGSGSIWMYKKTGNFMAHLHPPTSTGIVMYFFWEWKQLIL